MRKSWRFYYTSIEGIVFVIDSSSKERIEESRVELHQLMAEGDAKGVPLLILGNKQDKEGALTASELTKELELDSVIQHSRVEMIRVCEASATKGSGF